MKKKLNLKEHLNDDTLDLSMNELDEVPVKEIATFPRATTLDLSNNQLRSLQRIFSISLTHLVKLDLSENRLTELPENFGLLVHLNYLDLYKNNLTTLPYSFGNLKLLRWLDLKNNPLVPKMAKVAGQCINTSQCQLAARNVVRFLADLHRQQIEEEKRLLEQRRLQTERNLEQQEKKEAKKKKKKKAKNLENQKAVIENGTHKVEDERNESDEANKNVAENTAPAIKSGPSRISMFLSGIVKFIALTVMISMLSLFIISLVDEPTYGVVRTKMSEALNSASTRMPSNVLEIWNKSSNFLAKYGRQFLENSSIMFRTAIINLHEFYIWFSTDEKIQMYLETLSDYWHVLYIKIIEYVITTVNYISSYVKN